ncbi:UDP-3-O-acyl-N-acetylglucosamine deacetylase [Paracoccus yeei]|uniref:UDP-3-O-acyl-N-acetylglucosamine deacetylase n=2 Tax=Paracoccus TaxID=265 RepID=A0A1V0GPI3_9RHOB|nr:MULTISPECIES: UDP-3-O-acyl-N-acetylglucosamine deacetylase [Paracoccus]ARC35752.1 UDP-3-O-acyl-N-acetylglucosamine deacetylase [Paracoccus yeei]AWX92479.1 UDP-3-O-acyl-N-acetylglucosamine deacetylase [Paracoccus mutanolyticus]OWJ94395.1 UDP-3-O-[3-hydroxymyristoyl] N-acetylglucosamine deacetylase [Paracoccus yeei]QEU09593.1 UDP-3-O-acyl-N-acetylglucosamine deacetylase [Paracoccus yeei]
MQTTIASKAQFRGVGLHSGAAVRLAILPAPADHGIVFVRTDLGRARIPALWDHVTPSQLCTLLDNGQGATVSTVEHVMAALAGTGITNAVVEVNGPEIPILDGSSAPFVQGIVEAGLRYYPDAPLRAIRVLRDVEVRQGLAHARLSPADHLAIDFQIDFTDAAIGHQEKSLDMANGTFVHELMDSRTFCRQSDVVQMQQNGLALGGTYLNAVVVDGDKVLSPGGLRHKDEAVRHKMLDAMGDLALAGAPLLARYTGHRAGHAMTNKLLRALFAQPDAWEWVTVTPAIQRHLPGAGVISAAARAMPALAVA